MYRNQRWQRKNKTRQNAREIKEMIKIQEEIKEEEKIEYLFDDFGKPIAKKWKPNKLIHKDDFGEKNFNV